MTKQINISQEAEARREHRAWLADYARWRSEHRGALTMLTTVQAAILEREAALEAEAAEVQSHELELQDFDLLGIEQFNPAPEKQLPLHTEFARRHDEARKKYERTKKQHVSLLGEVEKLSRICQSRHSAAQSHL